MFTITATANTAGFATDTAKPRKESLFSRIANTVTPAVALKACAVGYWGVFWVMNGLDKFLNRSDLGLFNWYGKDRTNQFTEYFKRMDVNVDAINPVLFFAGIWELLVAVPLFYAMSLILRGQDSEKSERIMTWGYVLTALTMIAFSGFDVIAGDRAELREHGLYLALLFGCAIFTGLGKTRQAH